MPYADPLNDDPQGRLPLPDRLRYGHKKALPERVACAWGAEGRWKDEGGTVDVWLYDDRQSVFGRSPGALVEWVADRWESRLKPAIEQAAEDGRKGDIAIVETRRFTVRAFMIADGRLRLAAWLMG